MRLVPFVFLATVSAVLFVTDVVDPKIPPTRAVLPAFPIAVVLRVTASVSDGPWWPNTNLNAQLSHSVKVSFDKGFEAENREVISTLRWIHKHIRDTVFQRLEQYL